MELDLGRFEKKMAHLEKRASLIFANWLFGFASRRSEFYQDFAGAYRDGQGVVDYLTKQRARAVARRNSMSPLYQLWLNRMDTMSMSQAMRGSVPGVEYMVLAASEEAGKIDEGADFLADTIVRIAKMRLAIRLATATPIALLLFLAAMLVGFSLYFVPELTSAMPVDNWPASGRALHFVSSIVTNFGVPIAVLVGAASIWFVWSLPNWTGPLRRKLDDYLPYSIYRNYNGAMFLISLSSLMKAGVGLVDSLALLQQNESKWLRWHIGRILRGLDVHSDHAGLAFDTGILPRRITDRLIDIDEQSGFDTAIGKIGVSSMDKTQEAVESGARALNTLLIVVVGATMLFMAVGFLQTTFAIKGYVQGQMVGIGK